MDAFYDKCFDTDFPHVCYEGFSVILIGLIFSILNIYAFLKMTKYYGKMNFENTILLLSSIQSLMLLIEIFISKNLLKSIFIFIQISSMCLINLKFKKISKGFLYLKYNYLTITTAIVNIIYLIVFIIIYTLEHLDHIDSVLKYITIFYYIIELFSSILLTYNCCIFLGLMKHYQLSDNKDVNNNLVGNGLFYLVKKRQISLLYLGNIICSVISSVFDFIMNFIIDDEKEANKFYYVYYSYILFCFIHNSINYISFYWIIREQYNKQKDVQINEENEVNLFNPENPDDENVLDGKFIENEIISGFINVSRNKSDLRGPSVFSNYDK